MKNDDKDVYIEFGKRLKELRVQRGYTQIELANSIGLSQTAIVQYEAGSRKVPLKILKTFAKFYNLSLDQLIEPSDITNENINNEKQLTKYEVATEIGFTKEEIKILEAGTREIPRSFFEKFANYFDVDIENINALSLDTQRDHKHALITTDPVLTARYKKWQSAIGYNQFFTDEEVDKLIEYAKFLISQRD